MIDQQAPRTLLPLIAIALLIQACSTEELEREETVTSSTSALNAGWSPAVSDTVDGDWCHGAGRTLYQGDFNGDGRDDLLCHNATTGRRRIDFASEELDGFYRTDWDSLSYSNASQDWCTNAGEKIYIGDFNGDGKDDLLCHVGRGYANYGRRRIDFANGAGTFFGTNFNSQSYSNAEQHWCTNAGEKLHIGDFNGDGKDDLLCHVGRGYASYGRRRIDFANSAGTFFGTDFNSQDHSAANQRWCVGSGESVHVGDFNRDGKDDLLCFRASDGRMMIDHANSAGTFFGTNASSSEDWCGGTNQSLHKGDFNGDRRTDLLCHDSSTGHRALRYANIKGNFKSVCSDDAVQGDGRLQPFGVHFVVLSDPNHAIVTNRAANGMPSATSVHTHPFTGDPIRQVLDPSAYFRAEVDVINNYMHDESYGPLCDGKDCLRFDYSGHTLYSETTGSSCSALLKLGNPPGIQWSRSCEDFAGGYRCGEGSVASTSWTGTFKLAIAECTDPRLRKPGVINFYIIDHCDWDPATKGGISNSSCGTSESNGKRWPEMSVGAAYERLLHGPKNGGRAAARGVEPHELGHVFNIGHVWVGCQAHTNVMNKIPTETYCGGTPAPTCPPPVNGDRAAGFSTSIVPWDFDDACTTVNQISKMIGEAREAQTRWSCL